MSVFNFSSQDREPLTHPGDAAPAALPSRGSPFSRAGGAAFSLSAPAAVLLHALAAHARQTPEELIMALLAEEARAVGLSALARAVADHPETAEARERQAQGP